MSSPTGKTYRLKTIRDIAEQVPEDRLEVLFAEMLTGMLAAKKLEKSIRVVAEAITGEEVNPEDALLQWPEYYTWTDDGKGRITISIASPVEGLPDIKIERKIKGGAGK